MPVLYTSTRILRPFEDSKPMGLKADIAVLFLRVGLSGIFNVCTAEIAVCTHACSDACTWTPPPHTHTHVHVQTDMHTHTHTHTHTHVHVHTACTHTHTHMCVCTQAHTHTHTHTHTHHMHMHACMHTHTHTHTQVRKLNTGFSQTRSLVKRGRFSALSHHEHYCSWKQSWNGALLTQQTFSFHPPEFWPETTRCRSIVTKWAASAQGQSRCKQPPTPTHPPTHPRAFVCGQEQPRVCHSRRRPLSRPSPPLRGGSSNPACPMRKACCRVWPRGSVSIPAYLRLVGVAVGMRLLRGLPYCSVVVHGFSAWFVVLGGVEPVTCQN